MVHIGEKIRSLRRQKDLSQAWLADKMNVAVSYISKIENGGSDPDSELIKKFAHALGVSPTVFFEEEEPPTAGKVNEQFVGYNKKGVNNFIFPSNVTAQEREQILKVFHQLISANEDERLFALQVMERVLAREKT